MFSLFLSVRILLYSIRTVLLIITNYDVLDTELNLTIHVRGTIKGLYRRHLSTKLMLVYSRYCTVIMLYLSFDFYDIIICRLATLVPATYVRTIYVQPAGTGTTGMLLYYSHILYCEFQGLNIVSDGIYRTCVSVNSFCLFDFRDKDDDDHSVLWQR